MFAYRLVKRPEIRLKLDKYILSWPLIGNLIKEYSAARYTSTLGMLQGSGVPLLQGLEISAAVVENRYIRMCAEELTRKVSEGISLSQAMEQGDILPPVLISMTASGEASGQLGAMLSRASAMMQRNVENRTAIVLGVFEPMVLLVMGGIVLLLVLAIILPILNLNQLVK
jgi:general secretion pathway protein F